MITSFAQLADKLNPAKKVRLCVAGALDKDILLAVKHAYDKGYAQAVLVGDVQAINTLAKEIGFEDFTAYAPRENRNPAEEAVALIHEGKAQVLMKGTVDTTTYMRAILNKEKGLRTDKLMTAFGAYEVPGYHKLVFGSDSGIAVAPNLEQKKDIIHNALAVLRAIGYERPKIACLAASEVVNEKIPASFDADQLVKASHTGIFGSCLAEGPLALDVIFSQEAAEHKNIKSDIAGDVDFILFPNMETGNAIAKTWLHFCQAKWGGLVLGCSTPIILGSRSDTAKVKINSIILGCLYAQANI